MPEIIYISRYYVEIGPFKLKEILDFRKRSILLDSDYLREASSESWVPAAAWLGKFGGSASKKKPAAKKALARKQAVKKKTE